jgi:hypothetical protein
MANPNSSHRAWAKTRREAAGELAWTKRRDGVRARIPARLASAANRPGSTIDWEARVQVARAIAATAHTTKGGAPD